MALSSETRRLGAITILCSALAFGMTQVHPAKEPQQVTKDGLELVKRTKQRLVYVRPGATFTQYNRVTILECYVEFSKRWLRDYNNSVDMHRKISEKDLERARTELSAQFKKIFTKELASGGYQISDAPAPDVLTVRPALVNIAVSAPDLMTPGRSVVYAQSAGQMTLFLELWDSAEEKILARVMDAQADPTLYGQRMSSVTNRAAADRIMSTWAEELRRKLDLARGKSTAD